MENSGSSPIVGVFRDQEKAEQAIEKLKQAGFSDDEVTSKVLNLSKASEEQSPETTRTVVTVRSEGKEKQAFGILFSNGANNADLPPGITLSDGRITGSGEETVPFIPKPELEGTFSNDSFFGQDKDLETTDQLGQMDKL